MLVGSNTNGGVNVSGWTVVGPARCQGCTQVWRASTPKGLESRQFYVNGVRANRTWAPVQQSMENGTARGPTSGDPTSDKIVLPGHQAMLAWTHNISAIELVYAALSLLARTPTYKTEKPAWRRYRGAYRLVSYIKSLKSIHCCCLIVDQLLIKPMDCTVLEVSGLSRDVH